MNDNTRNRTLKKNSDNAENSTPQSILKHIPKSIKILLIIVGIIFDLAAVGIVPLNLFYFAMPESISIFLSLLIVVVTVVLWIQKRKRKFAMILFSVINVIVIGFSLFATYCNPFWNSITWRNNAFYKTYAYDQVLTYEQAKEDYDYAMHYLKKCHPALLKEMPKEIQDQCNLVEENLKNYDTITINNLSREIESIFSLLSDGHSYVGGNYADIHYLNYSLEHENENIRLIKVNDIKVEDILMQNTELFSYEIITSGIDQLRSELTSIEGLVYLEFPFQEGIDYTYQDEDGLLETIHATPEDFITRKEYESLNPKDEQEKENQGFVYYQIIPEENLALLTLDKCNNSSKYRNCLNEMFTKVKELGIQNVAVDLRNNGGGGTSTSNEFLRYLDIDSYKEGAYKLRLGCFNIKINESTTHNEKYSDLLFHGNLYVLTSVKTFSAAREFAGFIQDNHLGMIIGETPGNKIAAYGQVATFKLPNSQLYMQVSTAKFEGINHEGDDAFIEPEMKCNSLEALDQLFDIIEVEK